MCLFEFVFYSRICFNAEANYLLQTISNTMLVPELIQDILTLILHANTEETLMGG